VTDCAALGCGTVLSGGGRGEVRISCADGSEAAGGGGCCRLFLRTGRGGGESSRGGRGGTAAAAVGEEDEEGVEEAVEAETPEVGEASGGSPANCRAGKATYAASSGAGVG
jgi:hypothetical protein